MNVRVCRDCGEEYRPEIAICADCGGELVSQWEDENGVRMVPAVPFAPPLELPSYQIHARHPDLPDVLFLDLMLTDTSGGVWHYRRDPAITLPLERARRLGAQGIAYLAPEAVLLFKSGSSGKEPRGKDAAVSEQVKELLKVTNVCRRELVDHGVIASE